MSRSQVTALAAKLDLGREMGDMCGSVGPKMITPRRWYPSLWIEGQTEPIDLPEKGRAVIDYKVSRATTTTVDGKKRHEASLEVTSIEPYVPEKKSRLPGSAKPLKGFAARLRTLAFGDGRPRNNEGEFAPQTEGGPDPNAMARAYGPAAIRRSSGAGLAAAGLGGAAVGAVAAKRFRWATPRI